MLRCPTCGELFEHETLCPTDGAGLLPVDAVEEEWDDDEPDDSFVGLTLESGISLVAIAGEGAMGNRL